jgi:integrase
MATISIRNGVYILDWRDAAGRHRKGLGKVGVVPEKKIKDILKAKELELSTGANLLNFKISNAMPFGVLCHEYMLWHQSRYPSSTSRTQQIITQHLLPQFEYTAIDMIAEHDADIYQSLRRGLVKSQTIIKEVRTLKAILNYAVSKRYMPENMMQYVEPPKSLDSKPHLFYEKQHLQKLYEAATDTHRALWRLFANTGLRRSEGLMLKKSWIGRDEMKVLSTEDNRTKSGKWREIPLSDGAQEALADIKGEDGYVLPRMNKVSLSRECARDIEIAKIGGSLHTLRHTYISHLVRAGVPLRTVQIYAGHAHYSTTEGYAYLAPGNRHRAVMRLSL